MNFPNHFRAGLDFPEIFIPTAQNGLIWATLMYLLTESHYVETTL